MRKEGEYMAKIAYGEYTIINVEEPFSVILSNEAQSIPTDVIEKLQRISFVIQI